MTTTRAPEADADADVQPDARPESRLPYEPPELVDRGNVDATTQSGPGGTPSVDGTYS